MAIVKVYCNTNIFIDRIRERNNRLRPLYDFAFEFFRRGTSCEFILIISDWLEAELKKELSDKEMKEAEDIFTSFKEKDKLIYAKEEKGDRDKARQISEHWQDPLHAILAHKVGADYLATRNIDDYEGCQHLVKIVFPEFI